MLLAFPPPPPQPQAPSTPSIVVMTVDTTPGDSVRVILERDFTNGDRLTVVVTDSASRAAMLPVPDSAPDTTELARYNLTFALRVARTAHGYRVGLYDVAGHHFTHAFTFAVTTDSAGLPTRWRIHQIADEVERWITGTRGIAATRVAYVYENKIHVIDSDGANDQEFTTQGVALSPSWHPSGTALVYSDLMDAGTQIGRIDLATGKVHLFSLTRRGLNITPVFTPRGDSIVYATASVRGARLVIMSATGRGHVHLFRPIMPIDLRDMAEPTFSPDGKNVAFVSSRPLYPQIYTMRINGHHIQRLVPYTPGLRNERTAPDWSPDGKTIVYQQQNHKFQIWIAQLHDGVATTTTRLTTDAENRDPSWAPDSRHLVLTSTHGGDQQLWILDTISGRWRQLTNSVGARLAAWSPRLKK
ncbi:MAG TPA: hypothetical protein VNU46_04605 [Gemmatimonadaceae bacterium]|jgi:TolB protein|nr:hypothetical protein [Gemmatimonadaceae bacterium]